MSANQTLTSGQYPDPTRRMLIAIPSMLASTMVAVDITIANVALGELLPETLRNEGAAMVANVEIDQLAFVLSLAMIPLIMLLRVAKQRVGASPLPVME